MAEHDSEEKRLRSAALRNATAILAARQRAERHLLEAKEELERKTNELDHSLALMRATLESTTDAILATDANGCVTAFNQNFVDMWRVPLEVMALREHRRILDVTGKFFSEPDRFRGRVEEIYAESPPQSFDLLEWADGTAIERYSKIQFVDRRNVGRVWSFRDITQHKRGEAALRASEERFRNMADNAPVMVWVTEPDTTCTYLSKSWYEFTGQDPTSGLGFGWMQAVHSEDRGVVETIQRAAAERREAFRLEYRLRRADGEFRWVIGAAAPYFGGQHAFLGHVGSIIDITERKTAEQRLHEFNLELEKKVGERTLELQEANRALLQDMEERRKLEAQLLQAQKMESIGTLAGGIAHDFNNLLNIIQGYVSVLRAHTVENKETSESLAVLDETIQRGSALVRQLLTLARKNEVKTASMDVNKLVEGLIRLIRQTFPKTIEVSADLEPHLPPVISDGSQLELALLNLAVNARDAMPNGGSLIFKTKSVAGARLRDLKARATADAYVCIEISDSGLGMDEAVRTRIFEPFFTTKKIGEGTGLGLSVVYGIVKAHNGLIDVESKPQRGTTFQLYLPVMPHIESPTEHPGSQPVAETAPGSTASATVLLVEDEKNMVYLLEKVLSRQGYKVLTALDGEAALDVFMREKDDIDAILLDMGIPKLSGREVLSKVQQEKPDAKVIISSGYLEPDLKSQISHARVTHFLHKPYLPDEVVKLLRTLMEQRPASPSCS
jgi:PAS domain S-box-containing protein